MLRVPGSAVVPGLLLLWSFSHSLDLISAATTVEAPKTCSPKQFVCQDQVTCISKGWRCDGEKDCPDGSDEAPEVCPHTRVSPCPPNEHHCEGTEVCVHMSKMCNGVSDCPDGSDEGAHCRDFDECTVYGTCSQTCTNTEGSYFCSCVEGYLAQPDNRSCKAKNVPVDRLPVLLIANSQNIQATSLSGASSSSLYTSTKQTTAMDFLYKQEMVCWIHVGDTPSGTQLKCAKIPGLKSFTDERVINISLSLHHFDECTVYGTCSQTCTNTEGSYFCSCVEGYLAQPDNRSCKAKNVPVDRLPVLLIANSQNIQATSLSGASSSSLYTSTKQTTAMDFLYKQEMVCWIHVGDTPSGTQLKCAKIPGLKSFTDERVINISLSLHHVEQMAIDWLTGNFYFVDDVDDRIFVCDKDGVTCVTLLDQELYNPKGIALDPTMGSHACELDQFGKPGGCSDICLLGNSHKSRTCRCRSGFSLGSDGKSCKKPEHELFLVYGKGRPGVIRGMDINPKVQDEYMIPIENLMNPRALDFHAQSNFIYFSDATSYLIGRQKIDGTERDTILKEGVHTVEGIAVDWMANNLYWTDDGPKKTISVARLEKAAQTRKILIEGKMTHPRAIVVDPKNGWMYWTDWEEDPKESKRGKIERSWMDGTNRNILLTSKTVLWPNGLSLDVPQGILYWVDAYYDRIEMVYLNSTERKTVYEGQELSHAFGLCHYKNFLFWNEYRSGSIYKLDQDTKSVTLLRNERPPIFEIRMYDAQQQQGTNACRANNGGCSILCLATPVGRSCACAEDQLLDPADNTSCKDNDCGDNSDEAGCTHSCSSTQFKCDSGRCIPDYWTCDGDNDCNDFSDETHANCSNNATRPPGGCHTDEFQCRMDSLCIPLRWRCDGDTDCVDMSDEKNCEGVTNICDPAVKFGCRDSDNDCGDNSDEAGCTHSCSSTQFKCDSGRCIPDYWTCDGDNDCNDFSDETHANCSNNATRPPGGCHTDEFQCRMDSLCIPLRWRCDGDTDCVDMSDEKNCEGVTNICDPAVKFGCRDSDLCSLENGGCSHNCSVAPGLGIVCSCPLGMELSANNKSCQIQGFCAKHLKCSQRCEQDKFTVKCSCYDGWALEPDMESCRSTDPFKPFIIFSNRHEIRRIDLHKGEFSVLVPGLRNTIALDFHLNESALYWTDVVEDKIYRGKLSENGAALTSFDVVIQYGLATPEGLAVDWIAGNIYWVESNLDQIEVAKLDGTMRTTLLAGDVEHPRAIALDPREGILFWTDWDASMPRIEAASMSGFGRRTIHKETGNGGWPNGLTVDYLERRILWIDARSDAIYSAKYDGSGLIEVLRGHEYLSHPFAVTMYGGEVYWTDWRTNTLAKANKWTGSNVTVVQRTNTQPFDLQVYHPSRQPQESRQFLLYARQIEIRGVDIYNPYYNYIISFTVPDIDNVTVVDYDAVERRIYWSDVRTQTIKRAFINGTGIETVVSADLPNVHGLAVDWVSRNLFWTSYDANKKQINVARLDGSFKNAVIQGLNKPHCIVVHPTLGKMYWTDGDNISMANMDGTNHTVLFSNQRGPVGLSLDFDDSRLYWLSSGNGTISRCRLDGTGLEVLEGVKGKLNKPSALAIMGDKLWWADQGTDQIGTCDKSDGGNWKVLRNSTAPMMHMKIYNETVQTGSNLCSNYNGDCSQLCLPTSLTTRACMCTAGTHSNGSIKRGSKHNATDSVTLRTGLGVQLKDIKVFNRARQQGTNVCKENNGGCEQLCLYRGNGERSCACAHGALDEDGRSCRDYPGYLLYSERTILKSVHLSDEKNLNAPVKPFEDVEHMKNVIALAFDYRGGGGKGANRIFYSDIHFGNIQQISDDGSERKTVVESESLPRFIY
ncbi:hypothetical protein PDJAM_G00121580 [Pangasius djambal]|uniref:Uncharacterized protein n=1 Tax=Pangasius djambal TaxID=1691987 RepID=A0ACC5ZAH1_9TELE|nr:hypothetical protein [Pangasius djambal]